jgi:hypothetical protein
VGVLFAFGVVVRPYEPVCFAIGFTAASLAGAGALGSLTVRRKIRLDEFAAINGMAHQTNVPFDGRPGVLFAQGDSRRFNDLITVNSKYGFNEVGNYEYTVGSGKNRHSYTKGFMSLKLPRRLPHMVLDSHQNNYFGKISNLIVGFDRTKKSAWKGIMTNTLHCTLPNNTSKMLFMYLRLTLCRRSLIR